MSSKQVNPSIGIDLGTTYSCVGTFINSKVEIIANEHGDRTTPSYVAFTDEEILIGKAAKLQASKNVQNTFYDVKRFIGSSYNDPHVKKEIPYLAYHVYDENNRPRVKPTYKGVQKTMSPEEISTYFGKNEIYFRIIFRSRSKKCGYYSTSLFF